MSTCMLTCFLRPLVARYAAVFVFYAVKQNLCPQRTIIIAPLQHCPLWPHCTHFNLALYLIWPIRENGKRNTAPIWSINSNLTRQTCRIRIQSGDIANLALGLETWNPGLGAMGPKSWAMGPGPRASGPGTWAVGQRPRAPGP